MAVADPWGPAGLGEAGHHGAHALGTLATGGHMWSPYGATGVGNG